jgi:hypothetical protein
VLQRWTAPTTWGGSATTFWDDSDPTLVQHAYFTEAGIQETKSVDWALGEGSQATIERLDAFPAGPRYGAGPFPIEGVNYRARSADPNLDIPGDMLVCAVVRPDFDPIADGQERPIVSKGTGDGTRDIPAGGWSLMQMHESFCFHYEVRDANGVSRTAMAFTPMFSPNQNAHGLATSPPSAGDRNVAPLPSWVVVCGGRDGEQLRIAVNGTDTALTTTLGAAYGPVPRVLDAAAGHPATIGGYRDPLEFPGSEHLFGGRVYETAVWRVPATPENIQARLAAVQGLAEGATYTRNRPGPIVGADGKLHMTWRHAPRLDASKGMLFGLQSWNRVNYWMAGVLAPGNPNPMVFAASEDLSLWNASAAAAVVPDTGFPPPLPPTGVGRIAHRVTLPPGESLSLPLNQSLINPNTNVPVTGARTWDVPGAVHGQIWVRVPFAQPAGSVLRVRKTFPDDRTEITGGVIRDRYDISLASLTPGAWTRVWLNGTRGGADTGGALSTDGANAGTLFLENGGPGAITFNAWGIDLTQIGGGGDLNSASAVPAPFSVASPDPGPFIYDWSAANDLSGSFGPRFLQDVLQLPQVPASTAATGFCLSVDAQPADALAWDVRIHNSRTAIAWANHPDPKQVSRVLRLYVHGLDQPQGQQYQYKICFASRTLSTPGDWSTVQPEQVIACGPIPTGWTAGSRHNLKACSTPAGALSIYADYGVAGTAAIATGTLANVPDLGTGRLLIGNGVDARSSFSSPWHGYVSKAAVCRATDIAACE